jgi:hypothetical protein
VPTDQRATARQASHEFFLRLYLAECSVARTLSSFQARAGLALSEARLGNRQTPY